MIKVLVYQMGSQNDQIGITQVHVDQSYILLVVRVLHIDWRSQSSIVNKVLHIATLNGWVAYEV